MRDSQPLPEDAAAEPRRSYFTPSTETSASDAVAATVAPVSETRAVTPPVALAPATPVLAPPPTVAPIAAATGMPKLQPFALPLVELAQVAQSSGLSWVNSNAEKIATVQAAIAAEPKAIRVPRERPVVAQMDDGPLVLVETKRDLRNMTLPFEALQ